MSETSPRPIIIKKKIVKGGGHHGGAWKVAYADFVTAMMAFFLMMWLINSTTEAQKGGIAQYFSPSVPMSETSASLDGMFGGDSLLSTEDLADDPSDEDIAETQTNLNAELNAGAGADEMLAHLNIRMTADGLVIEIVDIAQKSLFESGSAVPSSLLRKIITAISPIIGQARNRIGISGHTDATPFMGDRGYDNWELSSDRANVTRRLMLSADIHPGRFVTVEGRAASDPITDNPFAPENRRISITLFHASRYPLFRAEPSIAPDQK